MMLNFRKAILTDADNLAKLRLELLIELVEKKTTEVGYDKLETANKIYFNSALRDNSFIAWLCLDGSEIIATSGLSFSVVPPFPECLDGKVAYIMNIYTSKDYRKQGIGTELFKRIVKEAKDLGYKKIHLNTSEMGKGLYEKYGFETENNYMVYYTE